jgi:hypothetical protein
MTLAGLAGSSRGHKTEGEDTRRERIYTPGERESSHGTINDSTSSSTQPIAEVYQPTEQAR